MGPRLPSGHNSLKSHPQTLLLIPILTRNLRYSPSFIPFPKQVSTKTPLYAIFVDTCRPQGLKSAIRGDRYPLFLLQKAIFWTPL